MPSLVSGLRVEPHSPNSVVLFVEESEPKEWVAQGWVLYIYIYIYGKGWVEFGYISFGLNGV